MEQERNPNKNAELAMEQNGNMIDGIINNLPAPPPAEETPAQPLVPEIVETQPEIPRQVSTVQGCDDMEGHDFEHLCADALRANGYKQVQVTQASGDYGIDVLAQNNGVSYAIQCKRYNSPVGNHAVQEAYAGAAYYGSSVPQPPGKWQPPWA